MYSFVLAIIYSFEMGCLMGLSLVLKKNSIGAIGIGAMIVFIAMVLVVGIAASVIIQTANDLSITSMETGSQTTDEVSAGLRIMDIEGLQDDRKLGGTWYNNSIHNLTLSVTTRAGSPEIDLSQIILEISNSDTKSVLSYNSGEPEFVDGVSSSGVFGCQDGGVNIFDQGTTTFGIIVLEDSDSSCDADSPVINKGDVVMICINASACFNGLETRTNVWGTILPEGGSLVPFSFRIPGLGSDTVFDLY
jgi:flagellin FlaB